jgi:multimeric flavodoxin WrbA
MITAMKITGIQGSPRGRHSSTLKLLDSALAGAQENGAEIEIIDITKAQIKYCKGCASCYRTSKCVQPDDFNVVFDKILASDGLVVASPVYFNSVSAQLKTFIDRTGDCRHCLLLSGKYGMSVATTAGSGIDQTIGYMNNYLVDCGAFTVGGVGITQPYAPGNMDIGVKKAREMGADLVNAIREKRQYPEQAQKQQEFIDIFKKVVLASKDYWTAEYNCYVARGWL